MAFYCLPLFFSVPCLEKKVRDLNGSLWRAFLALTWHSMAEYMVPSGATTVETAAIEPAAAAEDTIDHNKWTTLMPRAMRMVAGMDLTAKAATYSCV